ncbi:MAG: AmmeMemoRadiSam system protein B [Candidatus Ratteibacteria bacterium]|nr:AmmeMemoRadiSam system protein B [Candidatus Ratteibacteria bacterium]
MEREPFVAGQFYPGRADLIKKEIDKYHIKGGSKREVKGILSPHAGYIYSGKVAGAVFSQIANPDTVIILGPAHRAVGVTGALWKEGNWQTPLGSVEIDQELAEEILKASPLVKNDYQAHLGEHSLEVQLPFIQYFFPSTKIVPLVLGFSSFHQLEKISKGIVKAVKAGKKKVLILASSDMTHYQPQETAEKLDKLALEPLLKLEAKRFFDTVVANDISMCGYMPAAIMILACKALGAKRGELVMYATSGEASGNYSEVVGYAGVIVE